MTNFTQNPFCTLTVQANARKTVELLLLHPDLDPSLTNSQGDTAREVAERSGPLGPLFRAVMPRAVVVPKE